MVKKRFLNYKWLIRTFVGFLFYISLAIILSTNSVFSNPLINDGAEKDTLQQQLLNTIEEIRANCNLNPIETLEWTEKAIALSEKHQFENEKAELLRLKGLIYYYRGQYSTAFDCFVQSQNEFKRLNNLKGEASALNNIAVIYRHLGNVEKAFELDEQVLSMRIKANDSNKIAQSYNNMAVSLSDLNKNDQSLYYYKKAVDIYLRLNHTDDLDLSYNNIGNIFKSSGQLDSALYYYQLSLNHSQPLNHKQMMANSYIYIGQLHLAKGDDHLAKTNFLKGLELAQATNIVYEIEWAANSLQEVYAHLGDYEKAYQYLKLYKAMADSSQNIEITQKLAIAESEKRFEKERELTKIKMANEELANQLQINQHKQARDYAFLIGFGLFLLALVFYWAFITKNEQNKILIRQKEEITLQKEELQLQRDKIKELNLTKDKFFAIIAHDLKNPLGGITNLSEAIYTNYDILNSDKMKNYLLNLKITSGKVYELLENLLQWASLQLGVIQVKPQNFDLVELLKENQALLNVLAEQKNMSLRLLGSETAIAYADESMVKTVVRNLLTNALKFTPANGTIDIVLTAGDSFHEIAIKDTGIGIAPELLPTLFDIKTDKKQQRASKEQGVGLGLLLCKEFTNLNGGSIWVESELTKGSIFRFTVKAGTLG